jgi:hypothetical protein
MKQGAIRLLLSLVFATAVCAQSSTFESDAEGWLVAGLDPVAHVSSPPATTPATHTAVGLPGGGIVTGDVYYWTWLQAPAGYLGDRSSSYGQTISFDIRINFTDGVLESSTDLKEWRDMSPQPLSPVTLPVDSAVKFFRARRR